LQGFTTKTASLDKRKALLWFRTKCLPYIMEGKGRYVNGHRFCHHVSIALGKAGSDVDVSCTDKQLGGHPLPFRWVCILDARTFVCSNNACRAPLRASASPRCHVSLKRSEEAGRMEAFQMSTCPHSLCTER